MNARQKIVKWIYPALMKVSGALRKKSKMKTNTGGYSPAVSFYSLRTERNNGEEIDFKNFEGKKVLLVNTASECGYTPQYEELQRLYKEYGGRLVILGFPANDFGEQEKGDDQAIAAFCKINYDIGFPLARKSTVIRSSNQNPVFEWLTNRKENGWNDQQPTWNFSKYLVNEKGTLTHYFDPSVSPVGDEMRAALDQ